MTDAAGLVVGFDLDMTLLDSRAGIAATYDELSRETGVPIDAAAVVSRLGPPVQEEMANWFPAEQVDAATTRYLELYPEHAITPSTPMPGAEAALAAVRRHGGRSVVVTAKHTPNAELHLAHLGLDVDEVVGWLWGGAKGPALAERGAGVYVGDHVLDVAGARAAGATSVAVATGPCSAEELADAGADVVLASLAEFPGWLEQQGLTSRLADLEARLRGHGRVVVAFSGGVDSAFLLAAAVRALGAHNVVAATAVSDSLPAAELAAARELAADLGVRHLTPRTDEMARGGYRANAGDRCYFCKAELLDVLGPIADHEQAVVATGTNADDAAAGFRPGIRAAAERGAATPLLEAGLTKQQVRDASRRWGLSTWDKPAAACLSSRIAYGVQVTPHRLARVERAESGLRDWLRRRGADVRNLRVRDLGARARIEVDADLVGLVSDSEEARATVAAAGFTAVDVDERGFRSGSMNELLTDPERYR
ncbi:MAG TPA: ATP-dependent sacrificial sulfur transferase LarE [Nocardioidaceae bacterium]|nr:ATP-dependent sacrificial sulfur transferase LarE [Nocardioidaceae bacterium]